MNTIIEKIIFYKSIGMIFIIFFFELLLLLKIDIHFS